MQICATPAFSISTASGQPHASQCVLAIDFFGRSFTAAGLPATLGDSVAAVWAALPALLGDALTLAADDYDSWRVEASAAKKRFKTTHCHALLRAVVALATELRAQPAAAAALTEADTDFIDALRLLDEREAELAEAAAGAKAALAEELNDDV